MAYKNNLKAYNLAEGEKNATETFDSSKAPQVILKMKGNYKENKQVYFKILPQDIGVSGNCTIDDIIVIGNDKVQNPKPVLIWNGKTLKHKTDYTYTVESQKGTTECKEPGIYKVVLNGIGNFTGKLEMDYTILEDGKQIPMSQVKVSKIPAVKWEESIAKEGAKPQVTVTYKGEPLTEGTDYNIRYEKNYAVGTGYAVLTGSGTKYAGSVRIAFKITGTAMKKVEVTGVNPKGYEYTGTKMELLKLDNITMICNNKELLPQDYKVSYQKNTKKGTATMLLTGNPEKGYTGTKKVTFKITAKPVERLRVEVKVREKSGSIWTAPFMKGGSKPEVLVKDGKKVLVLGKDYTVSYKNNKNVGEKATLTIKGKGNYGKTVSAEFMVVQKDLEIYKGSVSVNAMDKVYSDTKSVWKPSFKVYDEDGKALAKNDIEKTEYRISYLPKPEEGSTLKVGDVLDLQADKNTILPIGTKIKISVTLKGNYKGVVEGIYRILTQDMISSRQL